MITCMIKIKNHFTTPNAIYQKRHEVLSEINVQMNEPTYFENQISKNKLVATSKTQNLKS